MFLKNESKSFFILWCSTFVISDQETNWASFHSIATWP